MKAKEEKKERTSVKIFLKTIITFLLFIVSATYTIIFCEIFFSKNNVYAQETLAEQEKAQEKAQETLAEQEKTYEHEISVKSATISESEQKKLTEQETLVPQKVEENTKAINNTNNIKISNASPINIEKIIEQNKQEKRREEYSTQETILEYITKYRNNAKLPKGTIQLVQEGREGKQQITTKKTYVGEELISEEQISSKTTKAALNKIVEIGTSNYINSYKAKVGDEVYVTSDRISVMCEPNEKSQKMGTLLSQEKLKILGIQGEWYKISSSGVIGYIKAEATTNIDANAEQEKVQANNQVKAKSKEELLSRLSFDMQLNTPSGLTLEQFQKILTDNQDINGIFQRNAQFFYYIEQQYKINGVFVAAIGIHESAWGTSQIAKNKNNLFGYGAYDNNPYNGAYNFTDYSECIDLIARVLVKYYLNPKGTSIYGGETAAGTYYNGATLSGVNTRYATDKNWANGVYSHMKYLYNKL